GMMSGLTVPPKRSASMLPMITAKPIGTPMSMRRRKETARIVSITAVLSPGQAAREEEEGDQPGADRHGRIGPAHRQAEARRDAAQAGGGEAVAEIGERTRHGDDDEIAHHRDGPLERLRQHVDEDGHR